MTVNKTVKSTLARLLAQEDILVEHRGVTTASFNLKNRVLTLPVWEEMSPAMYDYMTAHEVGHALETPCEGWSEAVERRKALKGYLNVIEDVRIEKIMRKRYPGLKKDFTKAYNELYERQFFGVDAPNKVLLIDRINCYFKGGIMLGINFTAEEAVLRDKVAAVTSWDEVEELALEILEFAKANKTPEPEKEEESGPEESEGETGGPSGPRIPPEFDEDEDEESESAEDEESESAEAESAEDEESESAEDEESESAEDEESELDEGEESESDEGEESESDEGEESEEGKEGGTSGSDELSDDEVESETDELLQRMLEETFGGASEKHHVQLNVNPKVKNIENRVISYNQILTDIDSINRYNNDIEHELDVIMSDFNKSNKAIINHMVREFEMKKRAAEYNRTSSSKTGIIDCSKLHMYKYSDDIFARMDVTPEGKNHGMIMYVDWSGSMGTSLNKVVEQLINLVAFCRQAGIEHRVFAFTDDAICRTELERSKIEVQDFEIDPNKAVLLEFFNSNMPKIKYIKMVKYLLAYSSRVTQGNYYTNRRTRRNVTITPRRNSLSFPEQYTLNGTPLAEALLLSFPMFDKFKADTRSDIITTIWLTDGAGCDPTYVNSNISCTKRYRETVCSRMGPEGVRLFTRLTVTNLANKESIILTQNHDIDCLCDALRSMYESYTNSNILGYFVIPNTWSKFADNTPASVKAKFGGGYTEEFEAYAKSCAKAGICVTRDTGYTEFYLISDDKLRVFSNTLDGLEENASPRKIASVYKKMGNKKNNSRVFVSKMMELVA